MRSWLCGIPLVMGVLLGGFAAHAGEQEHGDGLGHRHHASLFMGNTYSTEKSDNALSIGFDYEYRITKWVGTGVMYDYTSGNINAHVAAVPLFIHPVENVRVYIGPGLESKKHEEHGHTSDAEEFLVRIGVMYDWHVMERYSITPTFEVDFVDGEQSYIFGVGFGVLF